MKLDTKALLSVILSSMSEEERNSLINSLQNQTEKKFEDYKAEYLESLSLHSASYRKSVDYAFTLLIKFAGNIPLSEIDVKMVEKFIHTTFKRSKYVAANVYRTLKAAFNKARDLDYINTNPFTKVKLPKIQKTKPAFITLNDLEVILSKKRKTDGKEVDIIPEHLKDIFRFAIHTGLRGAEIVNLKWTNINLRERIIQVGDESFNTKSREVREVPINDSVYKILNARMKKILSIDGFVFEKVYGNAQFSKDATDRRFTVDYLSRKWKAACRAAGFDRVHFHSLRHSFASNLVNKKVNLYEVQKLLGHSDPSITQMYSHLQRESLRDAVNRLSVIEGGVNVNG